jgi:hypothetical protein
MKPTHRLLVKHAFKGGRFADHGVDLDVLPELIAYKNILIETAKELWRAKNPHRKYLPRRFEESLQLKFYNVERGSAVIPIERVLAVDDQENLFEEPDELDQAVELVSEAANAALLDKPLPQQFPTRILPMFEAYGKTLRQGEYFEYKTGTREITAKYTLDARERLIQRAVADYEDEVDIIGTVTMASVRKPKLGITLEDGREIEASFRPEDEAIVLEALTEHKSAKLRLKGRGLFRGTGMLQRILQTTMVTLLPTGNIEYTEGAKPIWEVFEEIMSTVPEEELKRLPTDGSINYDHYLYGYPKSFR